MKRLKIRQEGFTLFQAGLPNFPRNFTRDGIISAILTRNHIMLKHQLGFCALKQGTKRDPYTGEEPGKIFHEYPGVRFRGLSTEFNACDTTALFLIGFEFYEKIAGDRSLRSKYRKNINAAADYILSHLKDNMFIESPKFCGSDRFALRTTYWKDSVLLGRENNGIKYPVVYTLAHIQNMRALRGAAKLLGSHNLEKKSEEMMEGLYRLFDLQLGEFCIAVDSQGPIRAIDSDSLHALFYLSPHDITYSQVRKIADSSKVLETSLGYRVLDPKAALKIRYGYHARTVWPFEQAIINIGARKFGLKHVEEVSSRITKWLDTDSEIFILDGKNVKKGGCDPQLWTMAAKTYFKSPKKNYFI